ncbi:uncharacterized protein DSM5745_01216 [Aspergillus mulundensis]|uniref:Uncharacterized protein n=1 Tax=Aspergillus mulundensis TaxID=1810919 RepID=A0A3D8T5U2_9EURO|nr:hypothetical protein DSM5745_01216 [Aspergillus mulundensis]RDW93894.1 hypothetical protein DSM5745_01216 [Aspergillus mulundensis]
MESDSDVAIEDTLSTLRDAPACDFLAKHHHKFYLKNHDPKLLDSAILCARRAVEVCSSMNPLLRTCCFRAANYLNLRHRRSNEPCDADLDDALKYLEKAANTLLDSESVRQKAKRLAVKADCHFRLFQAGRYGDFSKALYAFDEALKIWKEIGDWKKTARTLWDITALHAAKFDKDWNKDLSLLDLSVDYVDKAIEACGEDSELRAELLGDKIRLLERRAEHNDTKKEQNYKAAFELAEWVIRECGDPEQNPKSMIMNYQRWIKDPSLNLEALKQTMAPSQYYGATFPQRVYDATFKVHEASEKNFHDQYQTALRAAICQGPGLNSAIYAQEQLVAHLLESVKDKDQGEQQAEALDKLALLQQLRYEERRGMNDLLGVADSLNKAVSKTSDEHTRKLLERLRRAAKWYANSHDKVGSLKQTEWVERGIAAAQTAVDVAEGDMTISNREKAAAYNLLGHCLVEQFELDIEDYDVIEAAIEAGQKAVKLMETNEDNESDEAFKEEREGYDQDCDHWMEREKEATKWGR